MFLENNIVRHYLIFKLYTYYEMKWIYKSLRIFLGAIHLKHKTFVLILDPPPQRFAIWYNSVTPPPPFDLTF